MRMSSFQIENTLEAHKKRRGFKHYTKPSHWLFSSGRTHRKDPKIVVG